MAIRNITNTSILKIANSVTFIINASPIFCFSYPCIT